MERIEIMTSIVTSMMTNPDVTSKCSNPDGTFNSEKVINLADNLTGRIIDKIESIATLEEEEFMNDTMKRNAAHVPYNPNRINEIAHDEYEEVEEPEEIPHQIKRSRKIR